ncbi:hypothetical protein PoB_002780600 [Plakobranchus ocellatus]|uniref:Uncharacterized protein n=1 Tax=Plakobranchus ocellatus TaxID=259542 RepID=A0AAV3ZQG2_9GAST|nr:hypothetical protein PoB_002780600 [Plakobranchus ocellatus]
MARAGVPPGTSESKIFSYTTTPTRFLSRPVRFVTMFALSLVTLARIDDETVGKKTPHKTNPNPFQDDLKLLGALQAKVLLEVFRACDKHALADLREKKGEGRGREERRKGATNDGINLLPKQKKAYF